MLPVPLVSSPLVVAPLLVLVLGFAVVDPLPVPGSPVTAPLVPVPWPSPDALEDPPELPDVDVAPLVAAPVPVAPDVLLVSLPVWQIGRAHV